MNFITCPMPLVKIGIYMHCKKYMPTDEMTEPQYPADDGTLTAEQITQIQNAARKARGGEIKSTIFSRFYRHDH